MDARQQKIEELVAKGMDRDAVTSSFGGQNWESKTRSVMTSLWVIA